jgi:RNase P/RNase MRP subunit POP5
MREKKRFLVFQIIAKNRFNFDSVHNALQHECLDFLGTNGCSDAGIMFLKEKWDIENQTGVARVNTKFVDKLKTSLALTKKIEGKEVIVKNIGVSGVLKKAEEKFAS